MIFKTQKIVALRDFSDKVDELHIEKPKEETIDITLGIKNNLWGKPEGSKVVKEDSTANFFDSNGNFNYQYLANKNTAVYIEIEEGYQLKDITITDSSIQSNLFLTNFNSSKNPRLIYAFFLHVGQVLNVQGKKVSDTHIKSFIQNNADDSRLRILLLKQSCILGTIKFNDTDLLTADEFCTYLKMNRGTFNNKLSTGDIISGKSIGGSRRWVFKDIQKWVNNA
jgi:hypothetical protein